MFLDVPIGGRRRMKPTYLFSLDTETEVIMKLSIKRCKRIVFA